MHPVPTRLFGVFLILSLAASTIAGEYRIRITDRGGMMWDTVEGNHKGLTTAIGTVRIPKLPMPRQDWSDLSAHLHHPAKWEIAQVREVPADYSLESEWPSWRPYYAKRRRAATLLRFGRGPANIWRKNVGSFDEPRYAIKIELNPNPESDATLFLRGMEIDNVIYGEVVGNVRRVTVDGQEHQVRNLGAGQFIIGYFSAWPVRHQNTCNSRRYNDWPTKIEPGVVPARISFPWLDEEQWSVVDAQLMVDDILEDGYPP